MNLRYTTLANIPLKDIAATFNQAFEGYAVKLTITPERLAEKIRTEGIDLDLSIGAFDGEQMVAFIWHATELRNGQQLLYNGGTGVIPTHRGKKLVQGMYRFIAPKLKERQIEAIALEVIADNIPAIKTYEQLGFTSKRKLNCYKGSPTGEQTHTIREVGSLDFLDKEKFWDCEPTWQHNTAAIQLAIEENYIVVIEKGDEVVAYAVYYPVISRLKQLAVHKDHRRKGMATSLLQHLHQQFGELTMTNIDSGCSSANLFLSNLGMHNFIQQYEMWNHHMDF